MSALRSALVLSVVLLVSACASKGARDGADARNTPTSAPTSRGVTDFSGRDGAQLDAAAEARRALEARLANNVVYFDFDSTELKGDGAQVIQAFAAYLAANPAARVRLEGHTDERGTREYNVGLGERRSTAVEQALLRAGATPAQLNKLSYGEERPTCRESDESCWSMNRRVEIIRL
jgi:peptidoglycan-associated lipoprotein